MVSPMARSNSNCLPVFSVAAGIGMCETAHKTMPSPDNKPVSNRVLDTALVDKDSYEQAHLHRSKWREPLSMPVIASDMLTHADNKIS